MEPIGVYDLVRHWDEVSAILAPAVATDIRTMGQVKVALITQDMQPWRVPGGILVTATGNSLRTGLPMLWVLYVAGKAKREQYRQLSNELDALVRKSNCAGLQVEGRRAEKWARVLGGFEHVAGTGDDAIYARML